MTVILLIYLPLKLVNEALGYKKQDVKIGILPKIEKGVQIANSRLNSRV